MIISNEKAKQLFPDLTDDEIKEELLAIETSIRKYTNNKFQDLRVRHLGKFRFEDDKIYGDFKNTYFRAGDRLEINDSVINEGLYDIIEASESFLRVDKKFLDHYHYALLTKISYPHDIGKGVELLIKFSKERESKLGIKSETISRYSVTYGVSDESIEGYPVELMSFMRKYRKLRWL